ncbi:MAG TPA: hypothetical protein DDY31_20095 [Lachnospiraceae bacterium]|nr:hypothetical protein [Lachnospiraceae bacterium]
MRNKHETTSLPAVIWTVGFFCAFRIVFREKLCASCELAGMPDSDILIIHGEPCDSEQPKEVRM